MHQYRFVWTIGQIYDTKRKSRFFTTMGIRKGKFVPVQTNGTDSIRMCLRKISNFLHYLAYKFQIDKAGLCITINTHSFLKMSECLRIKSSTNRSFLTGSDGRFRPTGNGTGTRSGNIGQYQRLVSGIRNGILHIYRMFPFYLPEVMCLFIGRKTRLGNDRQSNNKKGNYKGYTAFHALHIIFGAQM